MKKAITNTNRYIPGTYSYYLALASLYILDQRDIINAKIAIGNAKKKSNNKIYVYSEAFLLLYEGKNLLSAYRKYMQAFKTSYDLSSLLTYIEFILSEDKDKQQLNMALALICQQLKDIKNAKKYAKGFLEFLAQEKDKHNEVRSYMEKIIAE